MRNPLPIATLLLGLALATTACAGTTTNDAPATTIAGAGAVVVELEPTANFVQGVCSTCGGERAHRAESPAPTGARVLGAPPRDSDEAFTIAAKEGGWTIPDLLQEVHRSTDIRFVVDQRCNQLKIARITLVGDVTVPRNRALDWVRAALWSQKMALVPQGPESDHRYAVMDVAHPNVQSSPTFVSEEHVESYADRDGLYVITTVQLSSTVNPSQVRSAASQFLTRTAAIGKVMAVDDPPALVVIDMAPSVAAVKRAVEATGAAYRPCACR